MTNQQLASRWQASSHHLAKVMRRLGHAGLVDSVRGPQGGLRLGKPSDHIRLIEVYEAVEGPLSDGSCLLGEPICETSHCVRGDVTPSHQPPARPVGFVECVVT